jgi:hypothetical protein
MTEAEMMEDLAAADAAGDEELARVIAARIKATRAGGAVQPTAAKAAPEEAQPAPRRKLGAGAKALNVVGRGAWALPGLVGLDYEKAQSLMGGGSREQNLGISKQVDEENPILSGLGRGAASVPGEALAWLAAPQVKSAQLGAGLTNAVKKGLEWFGTRPLERALTFAPRFGAGAAAAEYGSTAHKPTEERLMGAGEAGVGGALFGGAMAGALPNPAALAPRHGSVQEGAKPARRQVTPQAQRLMSEGVEGLTTGQKLGQESILGRLEGASADAPGGLRVERDAAKSSFRRTAMNRARAPSAAPSAATDMHQLYDDTLRGFNPDYAQVKGAQVSPEAMAGLTDVAQMPDRGVKLSTRQKAAGAIEDALTVLGDREAKDAPSLLVDEFGRDVPRAPQPLPEASTGDLMKVRESLREDHRAALRTGDYDRQNLLSTAISRVTQAINTALSPEQRALHRATDRQYRRLMTIEKAAPTGQVDFTPQQWLSAQEKNAGRRAFKRGRAGPDQSFAEDARDVFAEPPRTGWYQSITNFPVVRKMPGYLSRAMNTKPGQRALFHERTGISRKPRGGVSPDTLALIEALRGAYGDGEDQ